MPNIMGLKHLSNNMAVKLCQFLVKFVKPFLSIVVFFFIFCIDLFVHNLAMFMYFAVKGEMNVCIV